MNSDITDGILEIVNRVIDQRLHAREIEVLAILPLPDGSMVTADAATPAQWQATRDWLMQETLDKVEPLLDTVITLAVSHSVYLSKSSKGTQ